MEEMLGASNRVLTDWGSRRRSRHSPLLELAFSWRSPALLAEPRTQPDWVTATTSSYGGSQEAVTWVRIQPGRAASSSLSRLAQQPPSRVPSFLASLTIRRAWATSGKTTLAAPAYPMSPSTTQPRSFRGSTTVPAWAMR